MYSNSLFLLLSKLLIFTKEAMFCDTTDSKLVEKYFCQLERKETLLWCGKLLKPYVNVKKSMKKNKDYNDLINNKKC